MHFVSIIASSNADQARELGLRRIRQKIFAQGGMNAVTTNDESSGFRPTVFKLQLRSRVSVFHSNQLGSKHNRNLLSDDFISSAEP